MSLKQLLRPTNIRIRLGVGLVLAVLFCIHCTNTQATRDSSPVTVVSGYTVGQNPPQRLAELEKLARQDHAGLLKQAIANYCGNYQDYRCTFFKTERINGQLRPEQQIQVRFREKPFSVAMKWITNATKGEALLYVDGKWNNQMLIQPKGIYSFFTGGGVTRDPRSEEVMADTLRPVTLFGFRNMMQSLLDVYELAGGRKESAESFKGYAEVGGRKVMVLQRVLPSRKDYPAKTTTWYFDPEWMVPLGMESSDWNDEKLCKYVYCDVKFNIGLTDEDFAPQANGIQYKQ